MDKITHIEKYETVQKFTIIKTLPENRLTNPKRPPPNLPGLLHLLREPPIPPDVRQRPAHLLNLRPSSKLHTRHEHDRSRTALPHKERIINILVIRRFDGLTITKNDIFARFLIPEKAYGMHFEYR